MQVLHNNLEALRFGVRPFRCYRGVGTIWNLFVSVSDLFDAIEVAGPWISLVLLDTSWFSGHKTLILDILDFGEYQNLTILKTKILLKTIDFQVRLWNPWFPRFRRVPESNNLKKKIFLESIDFQVWLWNPWSPRLQGVRI